MSWPSPNGTSSWLAMESGFTHPAPVLRMKELTEWAESSAFRQLIGIADAGDMDSRVGCQQCAGTSSQPPGVFVNVAARQCRQTASPGDGAR